VSRTPIREALRRLDAEGLLERGNRGSLVVRERSPEEIIDVYDVRVLLEGEAARQASEKSGSIDHARLERLVERGLELETPRGEERALEHVALNREFHRSIWRAGRNQALFSVLERLEMHLLRFPATTLSFPGRWEEARDQHAAIADAIRDRDAERAKRLAEEHFIAARNIRIRLWEDA
jgi:DNA-binding GntR family transcriptional regulator